MGVGLGVLHIVIKQDAHPAAFIGGWSVSIVAVFVIWMTTEFIRSKRAARTRDRS
ncbi:hypothetical protein SAMN05216275_15052 [Streptosporangium canum]|uniref:Uncharacterized protein n=1 Tax=Streptosporangium canum TaxID=324952 RepID=A0A1I4ENN8_9ACTN|nr:hypothetical protein SAMN05216275_15052 [Streptosporangium canum]